MIFSNGHFLIALIAAITLSTLLLLKLPRFAIHIDLVDHPDERKQHNGKVPLIGGIAMFSAFSFSALFLDVPLGQLRGLFAGAMLLVIVGVLDDLHELTSVARFIAQILAAILMAEWGEVRLVDLGWISPSGELVQLNWWSSLLTIFAAVGIINAVNMMDGIDGLAGSISLVAVLSMAILAWHQGGAGSMQLLLLLSAVIMVFLFFNRHPASNTNNAEKNTGRQRVFMGDAGSMFLGFILVWFFIQLSQDSPSDSSRVMAPVTALWIFLVPLFDTVAQMFRRVLQGKSPFSADRKHIHHILLDRGHSKRDTLRILLSIAIAAAVIGITADISGFSQAFMFYLFLFLFVIYFTTVCYGTQVYRWMTETFRG